VTLDALCKQYPLLYHMATADALPQIEKYGLLSTQATLDLLGITGDRREELISRRRPTDVVLQCKTYGKFVLRDQIPMRDGALAKCLVGMSPPEWYRMLNERVFMWASKERVETLLGARAYRKKSHLVITLDTAKIVSAHGPQLRLSSINSGSTLYNPPKRGRNTFCPPNEFEMHNGRRRVVEVTVSISIPNFRDYIVDATVRKAGA
jgi:hypothetical protein